MQSVNWHNNGQVLGKVESLHLHSNSPGGEMHDAFTLELMAGKGIVGNKRYFTRPTRRQVTLIEREQLIELAALMGLDQIAPGCVRANIETSGIWFRNLIGQHIRIGSGVVLFLYEARIPCHKMDAIAPGLRALMENGRQGVLAQIVSSGIIQTGDAITLAKTDIRD